LVLQTVAISDGKRLSKSNATAISVNILTISNDPASGSFRELGKPSATHFDGRTMAVNRAVELRNNC
jgi:hypothetical protein